MPITYRMRGWSTLRSRMRGGGGGVSKGIAASLDSATDEELREALADLPVDGRDKISAALMPPAANHQAAPDVTSRPLDATEMEIIVALSKLDEPLCECLAAGHIRLLRTAWLEQQPDSYRIQRRQDLEELEANGVSPSPLLRPEEAVELIKRGDRSAGAVTYGWLTPGEVCFTSPLQLFPVQLRDAGLYTLTHTHQHSCTCTDVCC